MIPIKCSVSLNKIPLSKNLFYLHMRNPQREGGGTLPFLAYMGIWVYAAEQGMVFKVLNLRQGIQFHD